MTTPTYSIVIPVYNSDASVEELVRRITEVFRTEIGKGHEIILVDDGSSNPKTLETLERITAEVPEARAVTFTRNFGKPSALLCGFAEACGSWIITMDDDLQHLPEDIPKLISAGDHDVVMGGFSRREHGLFVRLGSRVKAWFDRIILRIPARTSPFQMIRSEVAKAMVETRSHRPFIPALMVAVTDDMVTVPVSHAPSQVGKSRYSLRRRVRQFLDLLIGNSSLTLRAIGILGILVALAGFAYALYLMLGVLMGGREPPPGWASIMVALLILNGLVLISTAISGEYFIRILNNTSARPLYVVRRRLGSREGRDDGRQDGC